MRPATRPVKIEFPKYLILSNQIKVECSNERKGTAWPPIYLGRGEHEGLRLDGAGPQQHLTAGTAGRERQSA